MPGPDKGSPYIVHYLGRGFLYIFDKKKRAKASSGKRTLMGMIVVAIRLGCFASRNW